MLKKLFNIIKIKTHILMIQNYIFFNIIFLNSRNVIF